MNTSQAIQSLGLMLLGIAAVQPCVRAGDERSGSEFVVTGKFDAELGRTISASWRNIGLRTIAERIADDRRISILLDRRLDPSREHRIELADRPLDAALDEIAASAGGAVSIVANTAYLGPEEPAGKLLTVVQLRSGELFDETGAVAKGRQIELSRRQTLTWDDLDTPADVLGAIAKRYKLSIEGLDSIPHDLWSGATLPNVNAAEALSLVLIQFDLTFDWTDGAAGIRLASVPDEIAIERQYSPRGGAAAEAVRRWQEEIPGLLAEVQGSRVQVRGTAEQHEAVENLLRPGSRRPRASAAREKSLARRLFTLRTERAPASAILDQLKKSGIEIRYDAQELEAAGVDLTKLITLEVDKATADEFFGKLCEPLGLTFEIEGMTVTLRPRSGQP